MGLEEIKKTLNERKLKATTMRVAVLEQFYNESNAIALSKLQESLGDFDRVTLYRTIQSLVKTGMIHKALEEKHETFYALCNDCTLHNHSHSHIHFKCDECGEVSCLDSNYSIQIKEDGVYKIKQLSIKASGICKNCA